MTVIDVPDARVAPSALRPVFLTLRLGLHLLVAGLTLTGPAVIEERESTTVLPPGTTAVVDAYGNLVATLA